MSCAVIFGGSGFIGCFFADFLLQNNFCEKVFLYDLEAPHEKPFRYRLELLAKQQGRLEYVKGDVRNKITWTPAESVKLIANFAAIHREPGHENCEYFLTNLRGAENVTTWAEDVDCKNLIFTSSISPYGVSEEPKDESTITVPVTAYGASKLVAEKIHLIWQARDAESRRLVIARPGVVFGPSEGGNVTRLIRAVRRGYFVYMANRNTRKAGIYVKELCRAMWWCHELLGNQTAGTILFNGTMNPGPSISEYVHAACKVADIKRTLPNIPYSFLIVSAYCIDVMCRALRISHPFSPIRIRKLVRSNNILPIFLLENNYPYELTLESAFEDWKQCYPEEWN